MRHTLLAAAHITIWKRAGGDYIGISQDTQGLLTTTITHDARLGQRVRLVHHAMFEAICGTTGRYTETPGGTTLLVGFQLGGCYLHVVTAIK